MVACRKPLIPELVEERLGARKLGYYMFETVESSVERLLSTGE